MLQSLRKILAANVRFIALFVRHITSAIPDLAWLAGLASVAAGISMIYLPAGVIAAGIGLCFMGYVLGEGDTG